MKSELKNGSLTVFLSGRVDSSNAEPVGEEIFGIIEKNPHETMVLDAQDLEYMSSAGLRCVLKVRKSEPTLKITNGSSEIYEIFEMTGFTEMMPIEKAYRRLSVEGKEVIGRGANGEVFRLDADTIIKVYFNPDSLPDIKRERELARKAFVLGIPTAIPYDVVKVGDSYGSVFELLNAKSFAQLINEDPENLDRYVDLYVDLLKKIHSTTVKEGDMPDTREVAIGWAKFLNGQLPDDIYEKLVKLISDVPHCDRMMHGDYHIKNVMMQNDDVLLIDMDTLSMGHPVFEFASIYLAYLGFSEINHDNVRSFLGIDYDTSKKIWERTIELYFGTSDKAALKEYEDKARVIGYTRLMRRTIRRESDTEAGKALIEACRRNLCELVPRVNSLSF